ncbi:hypothetical protein L8C07_18605 [Paenibacillus sp. CMAA1739]|nr:MULTISPECIES: hypothetical protein [Paenibacillus]MDP1511668.1 hypothetical protein [Paenibacillus ottowii]MEC4567964.1 hypothetical protein [Paenibacillus sp. CMAA1739]
MNLLPLSSANQEKSRNLASGSQEIYHMEGQALAVENEDML